MSNRSDASHPTSHSKDGTPSQEGVAPVPSVPAGPAAADRGVVAGVDIGGTTTHVVLCKPGFEVLARRSAPTPTAGGGTAMVGLAIDLIEQLLAEQPGGPGTLAAVGVGAAGVVDSQAGLVVVASDTFTDWAGYAVTRTITERLGVPAFLENDVNAFLLGEVSVGAIAGEANALAIMLGTGVGGALWIDGRLHGGPHGAAGEIGHVPGFGDLLCTCGRHGHLETRAGGGQISLRYAERSQRTGGGEVSAAEVYELALREDDAAADVLADAGRAVAQAITMVAALVDVTTVVIGGGVADAWPLLGPAMQRELEAEPPVSEIPILVRHSALGGDAVAIGAAIHAHRAHAAHRGLV